MDERTNLLSLLRRTGYERAPVEFHLCPDLVDEFYRRTDSDTDYFSFFNMPWRYVDDLRLRDTDSEKFRKFYQADLPAGTVIDIYGVAHVPGSHAAAHMTELRNPMSSFDSIEQIAAYPYPDFSRADRQHLKVQADDFHSRGLASVGNHQLSIWENAWFLRGMDNLMMDMLGDSDLAESVFDMVTEAVIVRANAYAEAGVDILFLGDDIGMQNNIMMSEEMYTTWIKPRLVEVIRGARSIKPDILVVYHSCGFIEPYIPHLIDAGIDVLNPVQPECMEFMHIHEKFGNDISFFGTIGTQSTMPFGTPGEVKKAVRKNLYIAGKMGGLLCAPTHLLEPDVPWDNIMAYVTACREWTG